MEFRKENEGYWTQRAASYSDVNKGELAGDNRVNWRNEICSHLTREQLAHPENVKVLDIGTGPGFFAIILAEAGFNVTAVDYTQAMLDEARSNAANVSKELASAITFARMDAQNMDFADDCFDVIVTRNLTWNLPEPSKAYAEWVRVLKKGGVLLNYDANWYNYLYDEKLKEAYEADRKASEEAEVEDQNVGENFDQMEEIARQVPLSDIRRPGWDLKVLGELPVDVQVNEQVWESVWSPEEKLNFSSTPMFGVEVRKHS